MGLISAIFGEQFDKELQRVTTEVDAASDFGVALKIINSFAEGFDNVTCDETVPYLKKQLAKSNEQIKILQTENAKLQQEVKDLIDPGRITVDYKQWQETQRKLKKAKWLMWWL